MTCISPSLWAANLCFAFLLLSVFAFLALLSSVSYSHALGAFHAHAVSICLFPCWEFVCSAVQCGVGWCAIECPCVWCRAVNPLLVCASCFLSYSSSLGRSRDSSVRRPVVCLSLCFPWGHCLAFSTRNLCG
ncbi:hypothetical protein DFH27DRAFT_186812 [Peziza echinospora]|nr:hypothetical protein DFH27DRAFT_186812 [Peziza echinospora]